MHTHHHRGQAAAFQAPVVRLDDAEIPAAEIAAEMQHHPAASGEEAWQAAAEALVLRRLLLAEAAREDLDALPEGEETEEDARIRCLLDRAVPAREPDEESCRRWYAANRARFRTAPAWHVAHILLAADPEDADARARAREGAELALDEVRRDPESFAGLARAMSACPSHEQGGDLGLVTRGSTVPEFEAALAVTPAGTVHPSVVETRFGFHVLRVLDRAEPRDVPYELARERIAGWLTDAAWRQAARHYMLVLASRARIEGVTLSARADGPLLQ